MIYFLVAAFRRENHWTNSMWRVCGWVWGCVDMNVCSAWGWASLVSRRPLEDEREKKSALILQSHQGGRFFSEETKTQEVREDEEGAEVESAAVAVPAYYVYAACCNVYLSRAEQTMCARYLCHYAADANTTCPTDTKTHREKERLIQIYSYASEESRLPLTPSSLSLHHALMKSFSTMSMLCVMPHTHTHTEIEPSRGLSPRIPGYSYPSSSSSSLSSHQRFNCFTHVKKCTRSVRH